LATSRIAIVDEWAETNPPVTRAEYQLVHLQVPFQAYKAKR
jgi:hypothetical protein